MKTNNFITTVGILILMIFLAGCTSADAPTQSNSQSVGAITTVGPTPTPIPRTIIGTWKVDHNGHSGTIKFRPDGYVDIDVSGYPGLSMGYNGDNNVYSASYYTYSAKFKYNPDSDTITSDQYQGIELKR